MRFALENPALFRLIFANPREVARRRTDRDHTPEAMRFLRANAAALAPAGSDPSVVALSAWSVAHGLAMLILDGQISDDPEIIEAVIGRW